MLNRLKKKQNPFIQKMYDIYEHNFRKIICISTGLIMLICKISLQFCSNFINSNKSNIFFIKNLAWWIKFPMSILHIVCSIFTLCDLIKDYKESRNKKELIKIFAKSANLGSNIIEVLMMLKIFHFLIKENIKTINYIRLTSTVLFLFISEPINFYFTYIKYQEIYKKFQNNKKDNKCIHELRKCKKGFFIGILTLSLSYFNFLLKKIETRTTPINLGYGITYNFNLSTIINIIYSTIFLAIYIDKLLIKNNPSTQLDNIINNQVNSKHNNIYVYNVN